MKSKLYDDRNLLHNFSLSFFLLSWDIFHHPKFRRHSLQETVIGHYFLVNDLISIVKEEFKKKYLEFSRFSGWVGLKKSIFQIFFLFEKNSYICISLE